MWLIITIGYIIPIIFCIIFLNIKIFRENIKRSQQTTLTRKDIYKDHTQMTLISFVPIINFMVLVGVSFYRIYLLTMRLLQSIFKGIYDKHLPKENNLDISSEPHVFHVPPGFSEIRNEQWKESKPEVPIPIIDKSEILDL